MWDYVAQFTEFSPDYLGNGYQFSNLILEHDRVHVYNGHTYVLHSDILKEYFDMEFIQFVIPYLFRKKYVYRIGNFCWSLIILIMHSIGLERLNMQEVKGR